jgi:hypothetical protein
MTDSREKRAEEIQRVIGEILYRDWDPIGVCGTGPKDEYDAYIGRIYRLLVSRPSWEIVANELIKIEKDHMGFDCVREGSLQGVAKKLLSINVNLGQ